MNSIEPIIVAVLVAFVQEFTFTRSRNSSVGRKFLLNNTFLKFATITYDCSIDIFQLRHCLILVDMREVEEPRNGRSWRTANEITERQHLLNDLYFKKTYMCINLCCGHTVHSPIVEINP